MDRVSNVLEEVGDVNYEVARQADLKAFEEINNSEVVKASLECCLSNNSEPTDYEAWLKGSERFADDNYEAMRRWVH